MTNWPTKSRTPGRATIKQRILTAVIALPLLVLVLGFVSPAVFSGIVALLLFFSLIEFNRMGLGSACRLEQWLAAILGTLPVPLLFAGQPQLILPFLTFTLIVLVLPFMARTKDFPAAQRQISWIFFGLFYLPGLLGYLVLLRQLQHGQRWIFLVLLSVMTCDSLAYFIGSRYGRRKLAPAISPNKTCEGALGGVFGAVLGALVASVSFLPAITAFEAVAIGVLLGIVGQLGDLFESLLKRACRVKDSGGLIPGHGGILDRLDSLLFAFPVAYYIARLGYGG